MTQIRTAQPADVQKLAQLLAANGLPLDGFPEDTPVIFCALAGRRVVGGAALEIHAEDALLRSVVVAEPFRNSGTGCALVREALEASRKRGLRSVYLLTETAAGFFSRFGFESIQRNEVPAIVQQSIEFTTACPSSAQAMRKNIDTQN